MHALRPIYSLGHNSGIFHNFLVTANWVANSYFQYFRVWSTANWLGNQCTLPCTVAKYLHITEDEIICITDLSLTVSLLLIAHASRTSHYFLLNFERFVQMLVSMGLICINGSFLSCYFHKCERWFHFNSLFNHDPSHLFCSFGFLPFFRHMS